MELPTDLKVEFREDVARYEEEKQMPFIDTLEEIRMERDRLELIETVLGAKFPAVCGELMSEIRRIHDLDQLKNVLRAAATADTPDELRKLWPNGADDQDPQKEIV